MTTLLQEWEPLAADFTGTSVPPNFGVRAGHRFIAFDDGIAVADEECFFAGFLADAYTADGLSVVVSWLAATAIINDVVIEVAFERHDAATDLDAPSFAAAKTVVSTAPGTSGFTQTAIVAFLNTEIDGLLASERFRIRVRLLNSSGSYTLVGDAQITGVKLTQAKNENQIRVREQDGTPSVQPVREIRVTNTTLTDEGGGIVSIDTGVGGGGGFFSDGTGTNAAIGKGATAPTAAGANALAQGDNVALSTLATETLGLGRNIDSQLTRSIVIGYDIQRLGALGTGSRAVVVGENIDIRLSSQSVIVGFNLSIGATQPAGDNSVIVGQSHTGIDDGCDNMVIVGNTNVFSAFTDHSVCVGNANTCETPNSLVVGSSNNVQVYEYDNTVICIGQGNYVYAQGYAIGVTYPLPVFACGINVSVTAKQTDYYRSLFAHGYNVTISQSAPYAYVADNCFIGSSIQNNGLSRECVFAQGNGIQAEGEFNFLQGQDVDIFGVASRGNFAQGKTIVITATSSNNFAQGRDHTIQTGINRGFVQGQNGRIQRNDQKCWPADDSDDATGASQYSFMPKGISTTDATQTTLATLDLQEDKAYAIWGYVVARNTTTPNENAIFVLTSAIGHRETAGAAVLTGSPIALTRSDQGGGSANLLCDLAASGNNILLRVTGEAGETYRWTGVLHFIERIG